MPAYWATVGRIIIALFFLSSGISKLIGEPGALQEMIRHGFPIAVPLYWITAIFETVVGGMLLLGISTAWSSALLALFTLLTALTIHDWWNDPAGSMERMSNLINFEKNFAIVGGLLVLAALGPAPWSIRPGLQQQPENWRGRQLH